MFVLFVVDLVDDLVNLCLDLFIESRVFPVLDVAALLGYYFGHVPLEVFPHLCFALVLVVF